MKYRKGSRAICTLYPGLPEEGQFTCLVVVGPKEADRAEALLAACDPYLRELYQAAGGTGGSRWLMIAVTSEGILEDVKALALNHLPPKYVVLAENEMIPKLTFYEGKYSSDITAQLLKACTMVAERPHHTRG